MIVRIAFTLLLILAIDLYFFQAVRHLTEGLTLSTGRWIKFGYWGLTILSFAALVAAILLTDVPPYVRFYLSSVVMVMTAPKLVGIVILLGEDLSRGVIAIWRTVSGTDGAAIPDRRDFLAKFTLMAAAVPFATMLHGMVSTAFNFAVRREQVVIPDLPSAFDGLRVAHISDMHCGSFASTDSVERAVELIMNEKPDIICFTGDMVNNKAEEAEPFREVLSRLKAPMGVFSVLGNHDYGDYVPWDSAIEKKANLDRLKTLQKEAGLDLLVNEHRMLERDGQRIAVAGVENWGAAMRFPKYGDLRKATHGTERTPFVLLLSHDPSHWEAEVVKDFPQVGLTLSGHTHGFQFGVDIPGFKWSPVQYVYRQWAGLYSNGKQHIYVNRGLGFLGFMGRVGIRPEITVLELVRSKEMA